MGSPTVFVNFWFSYSKPVHVNVLAHISWYMCFNLYWFVRPQVSSRTWPWWHGLLVLHLRQHISVHEVKHRLEHLRA
jgi:hypothetical protein